MATHTIGVVLYREGPDMLPQVESGAMPAVEEQLRAWLRGAGLLDADVVVVEPPAPEEPTDPPTA